MAVVEGLTNEMWPGTPVVPTMSTGATDSRFLRNLAVATARTQRSIDGLEGSTTAGERTIAFTGARPPKWPAANADGKHTYGKAVDLFDGKTWLSTLVDDDGETAISVKL